MHVQMRYGLAHHVVHGDEGALAAQGIAEGGGNPLGGAEQGRHRGGLEVEKGVDVAYRTDQRVPLEQWAVVEERDGVLVAMDGLGRDVTGDDGAEQVGHGIRCRNSVSSTPSVIRCSARPGGRSRFCIPSAASVNPRVKVLVTPGRSPTGPWRRWSPRRRGHGRRRCRPAGRGRSALRRGPRHCPAGSDPSPDVRE